MADFRDELHISRNKDQFGKPSFPPYYDWCHSRTDLTDNTVEVIDWGERDNIGKICQVIDNFEPTEQDVKLSIKAFLENDRFNDSEEY